MSFMNWVAHKNRKQKQAIRIGIIAGALTAAFGLGVIGTCSVDKYMEKKYSKNTQEQTKIEQQVQTPQSPLEQTLNQFDNGWSVKNELSPEELDSYSRDSPVIESFLSRDYVKQLTANFKELSNINQILYDGKLENGEAASARFVNDGRPFNLIYEIKGKDGSISYGFVKITPEHASELESKVKEYAEGKVENLFSNPKDGQTLNYDLVKAIIEGEGDYRIQPRTQVFTYAVGKSAEYEGKSSSQLKSYLKRLVDADSANGEFNSQKGYAVKLQENPDGTGYLTLNLGKKQVTLNYNDKDYFDEMKRVVEIVARDYQARHPNEDICTNSHNY